MLKLHKRISFKIWLSKIPLHLVKKFSNFKIRKKIIKDKAKQIRPISLETHKNIKNFIYEKCMRGRALKIPEWTIRRGLVEVNKKSKNILQSKNVRRKPIT